MFYLSLLSTAGVLKLRYVNRSCGPKKSVFTGARILLIARASVGLYSLMRILFTYYNDNKKTD
jgi:hypothetical protein